MPANDKIRAAIEIFKATLPEAKGKFRPRVSEVHTNDVEFFNDDGLYCIVNTKSKKIKGI